MDSGVLWLIAMLGAAWFFTFTIGFNAGIRFERFRHDKEVDAYVIPDERLGDGAYWKTRYEDLAVDWDKCLDKRLLQTEKLRAEEKDARRETTE